MKIENIEKIFMFTDLHFGIRANSLEWQEIQNEWADSFIDQVKKNYNFNKDTDILIIPGDIFNSREFLNMRTIKNTIEVFKNFSALFERGVFILLGNHDCYYKDNANITSLLLLDLFKNNINIFTKPEVFSISNLSNQVYNFFVLPWMRDYQKINKLIAEYSNQCEYMLAHFDVKDFKFTNQQNVYDGIDIKDLKNYKRIYSGHLHLKQEKDNLLYLGTPYQLDMHDVGEEKGFYILELKDNEISEKYIKNEFSPVFLKLKGTDILEMSVSELQKTIHNNFIDIYLEHKIFRKFPFIRFVDFLKESNIHTRRCEFIPYKTENVKNKMDKLVKITNDFNLIDASKEFLKIKGYNKNESNSVIGCFQKLYKKVKEDE